MGLLKRYGNDSLTEAGIDEAGRGCLAGPVVAAAVILPLDFECPKLNDSKQMSEADRYLCREQILQQATAYGIAYVQAERIDQINILQATFEAMHAAADALKVQPERLCIDGNRFRPHHIPHVSIVKGDGKYLHIAAASVLAKTFRDDLMRLLHKEYPHYRWDSNKGYPTAAHRQAIAEHGISPHHRKSFQLLEAWRLF